MDVVFFLKEIAKGKDLPWPRSTRLITLDPGAFRGSGADPLTSTAYAQLYASLRDENGQVIPALLRRHGIADPERIAFVGFSAAHGFLSPLLDHAADRRMVDSVILMDACFGAGKRGYQKALIDAAAGRLMLVAVTSHVGGPYERATVLNSGTLCFEQHVLGPTGLRPRRTEVRRPAPAPIGGAWRIGSTGFWLHYADNRGTVQVPHYEMGQLTRPIVEAYLLPRFRGEIGGTPLWMVAAVGAGLVGAGYWLWSRLKT